MDQWSALYQAGLGQSAGLTRRFARCAREDAARQFLKLAPTHHQLIDHTEQLLELRDVAARPRLNIAPQALEELIDRI